MYKAIVSDNDFDSKNLRIIKDGIPVLETYVAGIDNIRIDKDTGKILIAVEFEVDNIEIE